MLAQINTLIRENTLCVLATAGEEGPHTSLMAYVASSDGKQIFLVTPKDTLKYRNLCTQPKVSLMVDTREQAPRGAVQALTISGLAVEMTAPAELASTRALFEEKHPHLRRLMQGEQLAFIRVAIASVQLLDGPQKAHFVQMPPRA